MRTKVVSLSLLAMGMLRADLIPIQVGSGSVNCGIQSNVLTCDYSYAVNLAPGAQLTGADAAGEQDDEFFTIYDFGGYLEGSAAAAPGWSISAAKIGRTPAGVTVADDADRWNVTFLYAGPETLTAGSSPLYVGTFTLSSTLGPTWQSGVRTAQTTNGQTGLIVPNIGDVQLPGVSDGSGGTESQNLAAVPEPATAILLAGGLATLALRKRVGK